MYRTPHPPTAVVVSPATVPPFCRPLTERQAQGVARLRVLPVTLAWVAVAVVVQAEARELAVVTAFTIAIAATAVGYGWRWVSARRFVAAFERARASGLRGQREETMQLLARLAARCIRTPHQHAAVAVEYAMRISWWGERVQALAILDAVDASGWLELDMPSVLSSKRSPIESMRSWRVALLATRARCEILSGDHREGERSLARAEALVGAGVPPTILLFSRTLLDGIRGRYEQVVCAVEAVGEARDPLANALRAIRAFALERLGSAEADSALLEVCSPVFQAPASEPAGLPTVWPEFVAFLIQHGLLTHTPAEAQDR